MSFTPPDELQSEIHKRKKEKSRSSFRRALSLPGKRNRKPKSEKQTSYTTEDIDQNHSKRSSFRCREGDNGKNVPIVTKLLRRLSARDKPDRRPEEDHQQRRHSSRSGSRTRKRHRVFSRRDSCCAICKSESFFLPSYTQRQLSVKKKVNVKKTRSNSL